MISSMSPLLFASSLAWFTMCTKNGNARSGMDIKMVRCFSAACAEPSAVNARPRIATSLILLEYLIEFLVFESNLRGVDGGTGRANYNARDVPRECTN